MAKRRKMTDKTPRPEDVRLDAAAEGTGTQADTGEPAREAQREPMTKPQTDGVDDARLIAERAYERWLARGGQHGHDQEDWYEAEQTVRQKPDHQR